MLAASIAALLTGAAAACREPGNGAAGRPGTDQPATGAGAASTVPGSAVGSEADRAPAADGAGGGMKAYVDPKTGKLLDEPPPGAEPLPGDVLTPPPDARPRPAPGCGGLLDTAPGRHDDAQPDGD